MLIHYYPEVDWENEGKALGMHENTEKGVYTAAYRIDDVQILKMNSIVDWFMS